MKQVGDIELHSHFDIYTGETVITEYVVTEEDVRAADEQERQDNINKITARLNELDVIVPRVLEDIIEQTGVTVHQSKVDIINEKIKLRNELKTIL